MLRVTYSVHPPLQGKIRPAYLGDTQQLPLRSDDLTTDNSRPGITI